MKDLVDFKNQRINALQEELCRKDKLISNLETYIFELTDSSCPEEYKTIIRNQLLKED